MKISDKTRIIIDWILIAIVSLIFGAIMIFGVWWSLTQDTDTTDPTPVEVVGTYEVRDLHDETIPANVKVIVIFLKDSPKEYPYWYGTLDVDACKAGDPWTSTAYNMSDEEHKQFKCYPDTGEVGFYMKTSDSYTFVKAEPEHNSRNLQFP